MRKKIGRPKLPKGEAKVVVTLRMTPGERKAVRAAARRAGKTPVEWMRDTLVQAAHQEG